MLPLRTILPLLASLLLCGGCSTNHNWATVKHANSYDVPIIHGLKQNNGAAWPVTSPWNESVAHAANRSPVTLFWENPKPSVPLKVTHPGWAHLKSPGGCVLRLQVDEKGETTQVDTVNSYWSEQDTETGKRLLQHSLASLGHARFAPLIHEGVAKPYTTVVSLLFSAQSELNP